MHSVRPESWEFVVSQAVDVILELAPAHAIEPGGSIECQFPNSWLARECQSFTKQLQWDDAAADDYITVFAADSACRFELSVREREFDSGEPVSRHGRMLTATLVEGTVPAGDVITIEWRNTTSAWIAETDSVYVAVNGERLETLPEITTLPLEAVAVRVIAPSAVRPGEPFEVLIVSLDEFDNCSSSCFESTSLALADGTPLYEPLSFRGACRVQVTLEQEGIQRLRFGDVLSNAIRVTEQPAGPYWGDIHIHTCYSTDGMGRRFYEYARDVSGLDFAAAADHAESVIYNWEAMRGINERLNDPGRFVTILGYENALSYPSGHHNSYYLGDDGPVWTRESISHDMNAIWPELDPETTLTPPHHTGVNFGCPRGKGSAVVWEQEAPEFCPVAEIYSHHGFCELYDPHHQLAYETARAHDPGGRVCGSVPGRHYLRDAWAMGRRIGVYGSSDDHQAQGGRRTQGVAAVWAAELTRESVFRALQSRACYATTGERILLEFTVNEAGMGQELAVEQDREIVVRMAAYGTGDFTRAELIMLDFATGEYTTVIEERPCAMDWRASFTFDFTGDVMLYMRVTQAQMIRHRLPMAWSSPIWVVDASRHAPTR